MINDFGLECFGNTGQGYTLVTKDASGAWRKLYQSPRIPDFQTTRKPAAGPTSSTADRVSASR